MRFAELERRRELLAGVLALTSVPTSIAGAVEWHKRPADGFPQVGSSDAPMEPAPPPARWVYYPLDDGQWGVGGFDRWFIQDAALPTKEAVADWIWNKIALEFITSHVRPDGWRDDMWFLEHIPVGLIPQMLHWPRPARAHSRHPLPFTLWSMLSNPSTTTGELAGMGIDPHGPASTELLYLAGNPSAPVDVLEVLSGHPHHGIRWSAAGNPSLPQRTVKRLIPTADFGMRWYLAMSHPLPVETLRDWWLEDPALTWMLGKRVAEFSARQIREMADVAVAREDWHLASVLARSPRASEAVRRLLARNATASVASALLATPGLSPAVISILVDCPGKWAVGFRYKVEKGYQLPEAVVGPMLASRSAPVRALAASHPELTDDALISLANDLSLEVTSALVERPSLPSNVIDVLLGRSDPHLRYLLASRGHIPSV